MSGDNVADRPLIEDLRQLVRSVHTEPIGGSPRMYSRDLTSWRYHPAWTTIDESALAEEHQNVAAIISEYIFEFALKHPSAWSLRRWNEYTPRHDMVTIADRLGEDVSETLPPDTVDVLRYDSQVQQFFDKHSDLRLVIEHSLPEIQRLFGTSKLEILFLRDPEDGTEGLLASILTPLPIATALQKLDQFDDEWFLSHWPAVGGRLNFGVRYVDHTNL